ncbi:MAG: alpha/beta fold hydrolase, partial [Nocardioides sp.]|nr:alpha/beta fold hydrolase [Nocardioides sp.]
MLAYDRVGSGEPLLLIHGISHRRQAWAPIAERLADSFDVISVDLPGHGESPALDLRGRDLRDAITEELYELRDHLG